MIQPDTHANYMTKAAIRIAARLLEQRGEISISDIKAIPFLSKPYEVNAVVEYLIHHLNGELFQRKVSSRPISRWEQFIRIKN